MPRIFFLSLSLCILFLSCDSTQSGNDTDHPNFIPLAVGNEWFGVVRDSLGTARSTQVRVTTIRVVRDSVVNGEIWYEIKDHRGLSIVWNLQGSNWFTQRTDGLWNRSSPSRPFSDAFLALPFPTTTGSVSHPKSGISITLVDEVAPYILDGYGSISTIEYNVQLSAGYNPMDEASADPHETLGLFAFTDSVNLTHHYSQSLGPVFLSGIWVSMDRDTEKVVPVGTLSFELIEFRPAE